MKHLGFLTVLFALTLHAADKPFTMPGMKHDVEFAKAGDVSLTLDAFVPEGTGPFATCILVHGGGFTKGDKQTFITPLFEPLAKAGFTWFTINYRLALPRGPRLRRSAQQGHSSPTPRVEDRGIPPSKLRNLPAVPEEPAVSC